MATTRAYKNIRLFTHFVTLLNFVSNIILAVYFLVEIRFFQVESTLNLGFFDMQLCIKYTIIISTMMAFFSACAITSKVKLYMKMYMIFGFVGMCLLLSFLAFLAGPYKNIFETTFPMQYGSNTAIRFNVRMLLKCGETINNDCITVITARIRSIIKFYLIFGSISLLLTLILYLTARVALYVDITEPSRRIIPRIERNVQMGYDVETLRTRKFIDPELKFNAAIMDGRK